MSAPEMPPLPFPTRNRAAKAVRETEEQKKARETVETIARNINDLARSVRGLINGPLKRQTLLVLLASSSGLGKSTVDQVLTALEMLEQNWLK